MDLQAAELLSGRRWSTVKLAALVCLALACALLIGSLLMPARAEADARQNQPLTWVPSGPLSSTDR
jgi:hypothetical protein